MDNYSQNNIEDVVNELFPNHKGYFVEVGCWDGELISQTRKLENQGWTGLCIDPFPHGGFEDRHCQLVKIAIGQKEGFRQFMKVSIDTRDGGDVSYFSGFMEAVKDHLPLIMEHCKFTIETISCLRLQSVLDGRNAPKFIEFLSIDVEGAELEVLHSIDFGVYKFGIITYEHNANIERRNEIRSFLTRSGYVLYKEFRIDDVFVHSTIAT